MLEAVLVFESADDVGPGLAERTARRDPVLPECVDEVGEDQSATARLDVLAGFDRGLLRARPRLRRAERRERLRGLPGFSRTRAVYRKPSLRFRFVKVAIDSPPPSDGVAPVPRWYHGDRESL
jgi:hypothetical protein